MRFRRGYRRRRRATWGYANESILECNATTNVSYVWLLPPGRVNFLADTDRVPAIGFVGAHMWLDFTWINENANPQALPDITMYAIVSQQNPNSDVPNELDNIPWGAPQLPSAIANWDEHEEDGTESFLWIHHIKGTSPPNYAVGTNVPSTSSAGGNQVTLLSGGSTDTPVYMCKTFDVRAAWQPDVIIKSRRKVWKDEGICLVMRADSIPGPGVHADLTCRYRILVNRGR